MKTYHTDRKKWGRSVRVEEGDKFYWLDARPSQKLRNHSPDGFEWGYGGSGPAQLALAVLLDATQDQEKALKHYKAFKWKFVAGAAKEGFSVSDQEIREFVNEKEIPA
jgi:hypothetical protein